MKRLLSAAAALVLAAALCLTSCGDTDSSGASGAKAASPWGNPSAGQSSEEDSGDGKDSKEADEPAESEDEKSAADIPDASPDDGKITDTGDISAPDESSEAEAIPSPSAQNGFTGKWELTEVTMSGMSIKGDLQGIPIAIMFQFDIKDDGTGVMFNNAGDGEESKRYDLVWEEKDGGIIIKPAEDSEGKQLMLKPDGDSLVFGSELKGNKAFMKLSRVNKFTEYDPSQQPDISEDEDINDAGSFTMDDYVGKWELYEMTSGGISMKGDMFGMPIAVMFQFEFKADGTGTLDQRDDTDSASYQIQWEMTGTGLTVISPDEEDDETEMKFTVEDGKLVSSFNDGTAKVKIKLIKVDEFTPYSGEI